MAIEFPSSETVVICHECREDWDAHLRAARQRVMQEYYRQVEEFEDGDRVTKPDIATFSDTQVVPSFRDCVTVLRTAQLGPTGPQGPMGMAGRDAPGA